MLSIENGPKCGFKEAVVTLFLVLYRVLSYRSPTSERGFCAAPAGNRTRDLLYVIYTLLSTPAGSTQRHYITGGYQKKKDRNTRKSTSKEKLEVLAQPPYVPQGNGSQSPRLETRDRSTVAEVNPGSRYIHVKRE